MRCDNYIFSYVVLELLQYYIRKIHTGMGLTKYNNFKGQILQIPYLTLQKCYKYIYSKL